MKFTFTVTVEVERVEGKFASRDEIADYLREEIEGAIPGEVDGVGADGDSRYDVTDSTVEDAS
jgi:hypothetical protein